MALAILKTPGINATGRAQRLRKAVGELDGIITIDINYIADIVSIEYDSGRVTLSQIRKKTEFR